MADNILAIYCNYICKFIIFYNKDLIESLGGEKTISYLQILGDKTNIHVESCWYLSTLRAKILTDTAA